MSNRKELLSIFDKMEDERQAILKKLESHSDVLLSKKPTPNTWSVAEIFEHLTVAENGALSYLRKKIEYGGHRKSNATAGLKQRLLNIAISLPIKYKVPKILEKKEQVFVDYSDALNQWNEARNAMRTEYVNMDEKIIGNELFKHPAAGKMNVIQGLRFMREHVQHHSKQIDRTIKELL